MTAYVISRVRIDDAEGMAQYLQEVPPVVAAHGGEYVVRTADVTPLEGDWSHDRVVVLRFPDVAAAQAWYDSPDYAGLRALRQQASEAQIVVVPEDTSA